MKPSEAYRAAMRDLVRGGLAAGAVGFFVNLLHLALPLYTIQVYDRVLSSRSMETLTALLLLVAVILGFQLVLDVMRQRIFAILGGRLTARLGKPVFEASVETILRDGPGLAAKSARPRRPARLRRRRCHRDADRPGDGAARVAKSLAALVRTTRMAFRSPSSPPVPCWSSRRW